jgi:energy-coupling factor transporter ATP-binding protein EcfA2
MAQFHGPDRPSLPRRICRARFMRSSTSHLWYNRLQNAMMGRTLLLTGRPGVGKTTLIKTIAKALEARAGGFYTEEIRGPGGRKGFRLVTLDGQEAIMAHKDLREVGRPRVGRYGVDVQVIERVGVAALLRAIQGCCPTSAGRATRCRSDGHGQAKPLGRRSQSHAASGDVAGDGRKPG